MMRIALCNEVINNRSFAEQCVFAAEVGYDGLELAPFTFTEDPTRLTSQVLAAMRASLEDAGICMTGFHWLLERPAGLSITARDESIRRKTVEVMKCLIDQCAFLGGRYLVHGSPRQRIVEPGDTKADALERAEACFAAVADVARSAGVIYCVEPLPRTKTPIINTLEEAAQLVRNVSSPAIRSMLDCRACMLTEESQLLDLVKEWVPKGLIAHVHLNEATGEVPGNSEFKFSSLLETLDSLQYSGDVSVEPFNLRPVQDAALGRAIGYLRGIQEVLEIRGRGQANRLP